MLNDIAEVFNNLDKLEYEYIEAGSKIWVVDNFLPQHIYNECLREIDNPKIWEKEGMVKHPLPDTLRYEYTKFNEMPVMEVITHHLNSSKFMRWVEKLSFEEGLISDPYIWGGGVCKMPGGKSITLHTDFTWNAKLRLEHYMNVALYMNKEWHREWGGSLQFWNNNSTTCLADIDIKPNRLIFWDKPSKVIHGFKDILKCPENVTRDMLTVFYYKSNDVPKDRVSKSALARKEI